MPLLAVTASGALAYWSELPALDMYGLNDYYLPRHRPRSFGHGFIGHELGDGAYILRRQPDLILFHIWGYEKPGCLNGRQLLAAPAFHRDYALVTFETKEPIVVRTVVFVRKEGRIGIRREPSQVVVPAFLMGANRCSIARLGADGDMGVVVEPSCPARLAGLRLLPGSYRLEIRGASGPVHATVRDAGNAAVLGQGAMNLDLTVPPTAAAIDLELSGGPRGRVREVVLRRR